MARRIERLLTAREVAAILYGHLPIRHPYEKLLKAIERREVPPPINMSTGALEPTHRWLPDTLHFWRLARLRQPFLLDRAGAATLCALRPEPKKNTDAFKNAAAERRVPRPLALRPHVRTHRRPRPPLEEWLRTGETEGWGPLLWDTAEAARMLCLGPLDARKTGQYHGRLGTLDTVAPCIRGEFIRFEEPRPEKQVTRKITKGPRKGRVETFSAQWGPKVYVAREVIESALTSGVRPGRRMRSDWDQPPLLDATDLARLLHISVSQLHALRRAGKLPARVPLTQAKPTRLLRWSRSEVCAWLLAKEERAADCHGGLGNGAILSEEEIAAAFQIPVVTLRRLQIPNQAQGYLPHVVLRWLAELEEQQHSAEEKLAHIALLRPPEAARSLAVSAGKLATIDGETQRGILQLALPTPAVKSKTHHAKGGPVPLGYRLRSLRKALGLPLGEIPGGEVSEREACHALGICRETLLKIAGAQGDQEALLQGGRPDPWLPASQYVHLIEFCNRDLQIVRELASHRLGVSRKIRERRQQEELQAFRRKNPSLPSPITRDGQRFYSVRGIAAWLDALEAAEREKRVNPPAPPAPADKLPEAVDTPPQRKPPAPADAAHSAQEDGLTARVKAQPDRLVTIGEFATIVEKSRETIRLWQNTLRDCNAPDVPRGFLAPLSIKDRRFGARIPLHATVDALQRRHYIT